MLFPQVLPFVKQLKISFEKLTTKEKKIRSKNVGDAKEAN